MDYTKTIGYRGTIDSFEATSELLDYGVNPLDLVESIVTVDSRVLLSQADRFCASSDNVVAPNVSSGDKLNYRVFKTTMDPEAV